MALDVELKDLIFWTDQEVRMSDLNRQKPFKDKKKLTEMNSFKIQKESERQKKNAEEYNERMRKLNQAMSKNLSSNPREAMQKIQQQ